VYKNTIHHTQWWFHDGNNRCIFLHNQSSASAHGLGTCYHYKILSPIVPTDICIHDKIFCHVCIRRGAVAQSQEWRYSVSGQCAMWLQNITEVVMTKKKKKQQHMDRRSGTVDSSATESPSLNLTYTLYYMVFTFAILSSVGEPWWKWVGEILYVICHVCPRYFI